MYQCPNCGGNLRFDIVRQALFCEYCGTQADPYSFYKERDAQEKEASAEEYEVTVFTCPQCGSELVSEDTTAATFCSFCGASTILDSRISKERRPRSILPFTKTKEDCQAAYKKMLRRAVFAPRELKDEKLIEKFRAIYMPYWVYSFEKKEEITVPGKKTHRRGDYLITDHYSLSLQVEEAYQGLAYDASSTFSDSLSSVIAPFDLRERKAFVPTFLSGFYADTSDVEKYVYLSEAEGLVIQDASQCLAQSPVCRKYHAGQGDTQSTFRNALRPSDRTVELAMLPVWFLSYRNGDRVSYAVVNGQTGKAAADLPIDRKKYVIGSLILAIPLFFLLNLFLTITPGRILWIAVLLACLCILISNSQLTHILARESGEEDKGLASVRAASQRDSFAWEKRRPRWRPWSSTMGKVLLVILLFYGTALVPAFLRYITNGMIGGEVIMIVMPVFLFIGVKYIFSLSDGSRSSSRSEKPLGGGHFKEKWPVLRRPIAGITLALLILFVKPVSDWFYYLGAFVCMGTVLWALLDIIRQHNMLTTRKLPQLNRRGGDEVG